MRAATTILALLFLGCESVKQSTVPEYSIRPVYPGWVNLHENDQELAGISFFNDGETQSHEGKHPGGVIYVFWDGRVRQTVHKPDGTKVEDFWHRVAHWNRLDYSFGSDPNFERHKDPRLKKRG